MATIVEITDYLVAESVATAVGTDLFRDALPETSPDTAMAVVMTSGPPTEMGFGGPAGNREFPRMQFLSRAMAYADARANCQAAHDALGKVQATTLGTTFYEGIAPNAPFLLKVDATGRVIYALNAQITKELS